MFSWMEFNLEYFVYFAACLSIEHFFIVASDHVSSFHLCWQANGFEKLAIQASLHNAIIELNNQHELLICSNCLRDQLTSLYLVIIISLTQHYMIFSILVNLVSSPILCWYNTNVTTKYVKTLLAYICVSLLRRLLIMMKPWV